MDKPAAGEAVERRLAGACRTHGQSCSASERCCVPLICAGGCSMAPSDRNLKRDFAPVDGEQILNSLAELPITSWRYKTESGDARHIGPMAQDFMARFGVGTDDKYILQVDADGVALAAIKTLNDRVNRLARENAELRREVSRLDVSNTVSHSLRPAAARWSAADRAACSRSAVRRSSQAIVPF